MYKRRFLVEWFGTFFFRNFSQSGKNFLRLIINPPLSQWHWPTRRCYAGIKLKWERLKKKVDELMLTWHCLQIWTRYCMLTSTYVLRLFLPTGPKTFGGAQDTVGQNQLWSSILVLMHLRMDYGCPKIKKKICNDWPECG